MPNAMMCELAGLFLHPSFSFGSCGAPQTQNPKRRLLAKSVPGEAAKMKVMK